jgi:phosphonopyruvate decarboxylase
MGALPVIGSQAPKNLFHFVFNNCSYESVGGQPIPTDLLDFEGLARSCGYKSYHLFSDAGELENFVSKMDELEGPILVEIKINLFSRSDLGRPKTTPLENKLAFMEKFNGQADLL